MFTQEPASVCYSIMNNNKNVPKSYKRLQIDMQLILTLSSKAQLILLMVRMIMVHITRKIMIF